jgi:hypothetical protein
LVRLALSLSSGGVDAPLTMTARTALLKQLIADGTYPIDDAAIAEAIVVRAAARRAVPEVAFRCSSHQVKQQIRSFRPHRGARSFRLVRAQRRSLESRVAVAA